MKKLFALSLVAFVCVVSAQIKTRTITIRIPDTFTAEQEKFIIRSVMAQIETEMGRSLAVPTNDVAMWQTNVDQILKTNNLPTKYTVTNTAVAVEAPE